MPIGIPHGKVPLDRWRNLDRSSTQGETLEAFWPANGAGNAEQSSNRFPDIVYTVKIQRVQEPFYISKQFFDRS